MITPDQIRRLQAVQSKLMDRYIELMDPDGWPDDVPDDAKATRAARGDRVWIMKEANQAGVAIVRNEALMVVSVDGRAPANPEDAATGQQVEEALAEAEAIITKAKGTRFGPRAK